MRVCISHSSQDKAAVEKLATGLRERGIDVLDALRHPGSVTRRAEDPRA